MYDLRHRPPRQSICVGASNGFTLIEVVVALAILALSLAAIYESYGWSLRRSADVRQREIAWMTAQSLLDGARIGGSFAEGHKSGKSAEGLDWTMTVARYPAAVDPKSNAVVYEVTIVVSWSNESAKSLKFRSIEVGAVRT